MSSFGLSLSELDLEVAAAADQRAVAAAEHPGDDRLGK